jgi:phosphate transport system protein
VLAEQVISDQDKVTAMSAHAEESAFVFTSLQNVADVERMSALALHVAKIARRRHPSHALPEEVNGYFAEMGRLAVELGNSAQEVVLSGDPHRAAEIRHEDDAMERGSGGRRDTAGQVL